jgi:sterol 14-demethylase
VSAAPNSLDSSRPTGPPETAGQPAPLGSGSLPLLGHLLAVRKNPLAVMRKIHQECGEAGVMNLAGSRITLFYGAEAQEAFFRAPEEQLDQAAAYPFMAPIFGPGVVFDATPEQRKQAMRNQSLRDNMMRGHAEGISQEVRRMLADWGDSGELDLYDFFSELTLYTSSASLIGKSFRDEIGPEFVPLFKHLERGTDALAYVNPHLPLPVFWKRDRARRKMVEALEKIFERRAGDSNEYSDLFHILHSLKDKEGRRRYDDEQITGMFISMMFAGHHTSSTVGSWCLLELLMNPEWMRQVQTELDDLYADGREVSYQALREIPILERCLKESLRMHPPLVLLMRRVVGTPYHYKDIEVPVGEIVAVSPAVSNRMPEYFPDPDRFDPDRYAGDRNEDRQIFSWIPFGGGRHRCVGAAFAMMQLKAIFSIVLTEYEFELAAPNTSYDNDYTTMVIGLKQPCLVKYRRRSIRSQHLDRVNRVDHVSDASNDTTIRLDAEAARPYCIKVDLDLCQGHGVCVNEAPEIFELDGDESKVRILNEQPDQDHRPPIESAIRNCPTRAIALIETQSGR